MLAVSRGFPWLYYSRKFITHIIEPRYAGILKEHGEGTLFRLCKGEEGHFDDGNLIIFYLLIDETDGVIADVRFEGVGDTALIGAADSLCELLMRKNIHQAKRIGADLLDRSLRDDPHIPAFPESVYSHINRVLFALENALMQCQDIKVEDPYAHSPVSTEHAGSGIIYPGWDSMTVSEKARLIQDMLEKEVQPYVALDEGGVELKEYKEPFEVVVTYKGSCTNCYSSTGATLHAIGQILKEKIHPELIVVPDLSTLQF